LSGRGLCDELITRPEESYRLCCVVVCDLETSRIGAPYIYDISHLRVKCRIAMAKAALNKKRTLFTSTLDLELRKKLVKRYIWSIALYGAETWTLRAVDQKHLESFKMWYWRSREKISWTDHVRNEEVLLRVKEQRNILHEISKLRANWIGHILRRNCLLQRVIEGKIKGGIEVTGRRGRRRRKLLDDLKERRGYSHLNEEVLARTISRARFGRGFGPVVRQTTK